MQSRAADVDAYLAEVPTERWPVLVALRDRCRAALPGYEEGMAHGMPGYARRGIVAVAWASQKRYVSLYVMEAEVVDGHREELAASGASVGKGMHPIRRTGEDRPRPGRAAAAGDGRLGHRPLLGPILFAKRPPGRRLPNRGPASAGQTGRPSAE